MQTFAHQTHHTPPLDRRLPIEFIKQQCHEIVSPDIREIDPGTFSGWCGRFGVSGSQGSEVPIDVAAGLLTFAMLHWLEARKLNGRAYNRLYPMFYKKLKEIYG